MKFKTGDFRYLSSIPHLAGTPGDKKSAEYVEEQWRQQGLDVVQKTNYNILLDYPDETKYNTIQIRNSNDEVEKLIEVKEDVYNLNGSSLDYYAVSKPFLAYSMNGSETFVIKLNLKFVWLLVLIYFIFKKSQMFIMSTTAARRILSYF